MKGIKYSKAEDRIRRMALIVKMHCSKKTQLNIKSFLQVFASMKRDIEILSYSIKEKDSSELASEIYEAMIAPCEIPKQLIERFIADIVSSNVWSGLIENALDIVRAFPVEGEVYYTILNGLYLGDELMSNHDLEEKIGYSHPVYCKKKNQAIMLFGIAIWTELKKHWKNADEEIHRIMCKYGRLEECW